MKTLLLLTLYQLGSNPVGPNTLNSLPEISFNEGLIIGFIVLVFAYLNNKKKIKKFYLGFNIRKANRLTKRVAKVKDEYLKTSKNLLRDEISFITQKRLRILVSLLEDHFEQTKKSTMKTFNPYFFELISEIFECVQDLMSVSECVAPSIFNDFGCNDVLKRATSFISENAPQHPGFYRMCEKELGPLGDKCSNAIEGVKGKDLDILEHRLNQMMITVTSLIQR